MHSLTGWGSWSSSGGGSLPDWRFMKIIPLVAMLAGFAAMPNSAEAECMPTTVALSFDGHEVSMCYVEPDGDVGQAKSGIWASGQSGLLWFFNRDNAEVLVKVLDGCGVNGHRWVFVAPVTDLEFELWVTAPNGRRWTHSNPGGRTAAARSDTSAFPCDDDDEGDDDDDDDGPTGLSPIRLTVDSCTGGETSTGVWSVTVTGSVTAIRRTTNIRLEAWINDVRPGVLADPTYKIGERQVGTLAQGSTASYRISGSVFHRPHRCNVYARYGNLISGAARPSPVEGVLESTEDGPPPPP